MVVCIFLLLLATAIFFTTRWNVNVLGTTDTVSGVGKEYYIPFGTGTNTTTEWTDVKGVGAYIDSRLYGAVKKVVFEATVGVPSGNQIAFIRLYNTTDKHPVWYTEMQMSGTGPELLISSGITLDSGNKFYQVQMKSQMGAPTNLLQARMHILTY